MIFYQEYMSTSLSTPGLKLIVKAAEGRPCALALGAAPAEEENNDKKLHFSTVELMLLSSLSSYLI